MIAANVVGIISAGLWALVVRQWTDRHIRLTGEARALSIFVVRHAKAGSRHDWAGDDDTQRPLTKPGRRQAAALAERLAGEPISGLWSSPYLRCVQTIEPLAAARGLAIVAEPRIAEGAALTGSSSCSSTSPTAPCCAATATWSPTSSTCWCAGARTSRRRRTGARRRSGCSTRPTREGHVATAAAEPPPD